MAQNVEDFNADELKAPEWVNKDLFAEALKNWENGATDIVVKNLKLTPGTGKGDHYASVMFRATLEYQQQGEDKTKFMIIKVMPEADGQKKELFEESHIFETEIGMYSEVIPRFEEILRSFGDETVMGAKCLHYGLRPKKFIIFEDIVPLGYTVIRNRYLSLEELKAALTKLAKWQALSYKLSREEPALFDKYRYGFMAVKNLVESEFVTSGIDNFISLLESVDTLKQYKPYFESVKPELIKKCQASYKEYFDNRREDGIYVLCHGDFHVKNLMFKFDPGTTELEDVKLLDFQLTYMGPVANDLLFSRFMMLDTDNRANDFEEVINFYFDVFNNTLEKVGLEGRPLPTLEQIQENLRQNRHFEMFLLSSFLATALFFFRTNVNPEEILNNSEIRRNKMFLSNTDLIKELEVLLPKYSKLGYFERK